MHTPPRHFLDRVAVLALLILAGSFVAVPPGVAQDVPATLSQQQSFVKTFARPGRPTMTIYMWGAVGAPGIWRIEQDLDLVELLSAAGVQGVGTDQPGIRERVILRVYRMRNGARAKIYEERISDILEEGQDYPLLRENDIVEVETRTRRSVSLQIVSTLLGTASSLAVLIIQLSR